MNRIDPATWTQLILALAGALGALAAYLRSLANSKKLDHNTELTKQTASKVDANTAITQQIAQSTTGSHPVYIPQKNDSSQEN